MLLSPTERGILDLTIHLLPWLYKVLAPGVNTFGAFFCLPLDTAHQTWYGTLMKVKPVSMRNISAICIACGIRKSGEDLVGAVQNDVTGQTDYLCTSCMMDEIVKKHGSMEGFERFLSTEIEKKLPKKP